MGKKDVIKIENIKKSFKLKNEEINAIDDLSISFKSGEFYAIMGHSGSGKSTLINVIGLLEEIDSGSYFIDNVDTQALSSKERAYLRRDKFGFIFQEFCLDEYLKAKENVILPMIINKNIDPSKRDNKATELLKLVGVEDRMNHFPKEMSGGEKQRVAIARCLANDPEIILADEPTGNLDEENEEKIFELLRKLANDGKCVIVVSHTNEVKKYADKVYHIKKGKLVD